MDEVNGKDNEFTFVKYLNNKQIKDLNPLFRQFIDSIYNIQNDNEIIKCWLNHYPQKADIFIKINGIIRGISIKKGMKNSVHVERLSDFVSFLNDNKINQHTIDEYLKYHFTDGSNDGHGHKRIAISEYKAEHQKDIDLVNGIFNQDEILINAANRFVLKGNNSNYPIDALIYGTIDDFVWVTGSEIKKIILAKKNLYSTGIHFGPLSCQPKNRCLNYNPKYEKDRFCIQIKWYNLLDEILEYNNTHTYYEYSYSLWD